MVPLLALKNKYPLEILPLNGLRPSLVKGSDGGGLPAKGHRGEKLGVKNLHAAFLAVEPAG